MHPALLTALDGLEIDGTTARPGAIIGIMADCLMDAGHPAGDILAGLYAGAIRIARPMAGDGFSHWFARHWEVFGHGDGRQYRGGSPRKALLSYLRANGCAESLATA